MDDLENSTPETKGTRGLGTQQIQAVVFNTEDSQNQTESSIKSIVFTTEITGNNLVMFYL